MISLLGKIANSLTAGAGGRIEEDRIELSLEVRY
jgi:hypothetical protein